MFKQSWKTLLGGIVAIVAAITSALAMILDDNPATNPDWNLTIAAVMLVISQISNGVGLMFARDNDKSSNALGIK